LPWTGPFRALPWGGARPAVPAGPPAATPVPAGQPGQPFAGAQAPGWSGTDAAVTRLQAQLKVRSDDAGGHAPLGGLYLQKARETGDPSFYTLADGVLQRSLALDPDNAPALGGWGSLQLARHDFAGALETGQKGLRLAPGSWTMYGIVGDACTELGQYDAAVEAFQEMIDLRPDLASYSRVSYARELHGDLPGAIQAMRMAVDARAPLSEGTTWARVQLGNLYFTAGDLDAAEQQYRLTLRALPDYVHGLGGLARVAAARGQYPEAIDLYTRALRVAPFPDYAIALGDVYR